MPDRKVRQISRFADRSGNLNTVQELRGQVQGDSFLSKTPDRLDLDFHRFPSGLERYKRSKNERFTQREVPLG